MKLLRYLPFVFVVLLLNACMWGVPKTSPRSGITKDTLAYTWQTVFKQIPGCANKADSECTIVKIKYPVFINQKALNDTLIHDLISQFGIVKNSDSTIQQLANQFIKANTDNNKSSGKHEYRGNFGATVIRQDSGIITLKLEGYTLKGGTPQYFLTHFINWDSGGGKKIGLADILVNDYNDKLTKTADTIFRKNEKLSDTSSLVRDYFFKGGKFALNNNFLITPIGIRFLYNEYEIKPYAAGQTDLFIPYSKIKSLLLPHTVVAQYIK